MILTPADWVIVAIVGLSALVSIFRGFVKEALSLVVWIVTFVITGRFYEALATHLTFFEQDVSRKLAAIVLLFIVTLLVTGLCASLIRNLVHKTGLSGTDRLLGAVFGLLRGILVVCALVGGVMILSKLWILGFVEKEPWWTDSVFIPEIKQIVGWFFNQVGNAVNVPGTAPVPAA